MGDQSRVGGSGSANGSAPGESSTLRRLAQRGQGPQRPAPKRPGSGLYASGERVDVPVDVEMSEQENETIMLAAVEGEEAPKYSAPNVVDFSPLGIGANERRELALVWGRQAGHVLHPSVVLEEDVPLSEQATRIVRELSEVSADAWREHTLLALPIDAGFASALVSAVYRVHGVWPTVVTFYQPDPTGEPALWEIGHVEDLNL